MKQFPGFIKYRVLPTVVTVLFFSIGCIAQDVQVEKAGNDIWNWLSANWKWVAGIAILLIVISAIAGGSRSRRTTTVEEDGTGRVVRTTTTTDY